MTQAFNFNLMDDTFTLVSFLRTHDAAIVHSRFLSPLAVTALNALLCPRDPLPARMQQRTERRTERLRFIHFLCEADRLVAPTGRFLKPTLRIKRWLTASPLERAAQLFRAAFPDQPTRRLDELWRAYRLPGYQLAAPSLALAPLFDILRRVSTDERIKITTLLKLIPLPDDTADPASDSAEAILRGVLHYLEWFEAIQWHGSSTFQLTDLGVALLNQTPSPSKGEGSKTRTAPRSGASVPHASGGAGMRVTLESTNLKLDLDHPDYSTLYELSDYAELIGVKPQRRYRLDRDLIQRALQRSVTFDHILRFLETITGDALPDRLVTQLHEWAAQLDQISLRRVTLLEVRDPEVLTDLTRAHRVRQSLGRTLSPRAIVVREPRVPALLRQLAKRGLIPRTNLPADQLSHHRTTQLSPYRTSELSDYDTPVLAQLYYAARLNHELSDRLPAAYRLPYSIVLDLEAQITPHDRDLASELAREAAQILLKKEYRSQNTASPINRADSEFYILNSELQSTLAAIERAIQTNTPLTLTYYAATYDQVTTRVVEPLRLEWRYDIPYLIAYCRTRQDERTFRVDRIMEISEQAIP